MGNVNLDLSAVTEEKFGAVLQEAHNSLASGGVRLVAAVLQEVPLMADLLRYHQRYKAQGTPEAAAMLRLVERDILFISALWLMARTQEKIAQAQRN